MVRIVCVHSAAGAPRLLPASCGRIGVVGSLDACGESAEIASIEDVFVDPDRLRGLTPHQLERLIASPPPPNWQIETLGRGAHQGQGWLLREYGSNGRPTGRLIYWHPGGGHHGPGPYWRVCSPLGGRSAVVRSP